MKEKSIVVSVNHISQDEISDKKETIIRIDKSTVMNRIVVF